MSRERLFHSWTKSVCYLTLSAFFLFLANAPRALAQVDEGSIVGVVQDPSGAVVPGAQVTLLNTDQGITLNTTTSGAGEYTFSPVRIGHYSVSASAPGFSTTTQQNLEVKLDAHLQVNIQLKTGAATETVQVTTAPPELQTEEGSVGQTVTGQSVNNLPLNGRNFTFLAQLGAGVNTPQADTRGNAASGAFTANGLRPSQNNYLLDGIDNNSNAVDFLNGTNFVVLPPVDAISEFKVQTADFSAQLGRSAGAVMNATIKSGTNSIHGAVWEFFRNDKLDAADWFENNQGIKRGELRQNQFGATIGGPVIKNKIFFFGDYEGLRRVAGNTQSGVSVPTVARTKQWLHQSFRHHYRPGHQHPARRPRPQRTAWAQCSIRPPPARSPPASSDPVSGHQLQPPRATFAIRSAPAAASTTTYTLAACNLNQLPAGRLDPTRSSC